MLQRYERISIENWHFRSNKVSLAQTLGRSSRPPPTILLVRKLG